MQARHPALDPRRLDQEGIKERSTPSRRLLHDLQQSRRRQEDIIAVLKTVECTVQASLQVRHKELEKLYGKFDTHVLCDGLTSIAARS